MYWWEKILYPALILCSLSIPTEDTDYITLALGCSSSPCIVKANPGGTSNIFQPAIWELIHTNARSVVVIDGPCMSYCTITADRLRGTGKICITPNAIMGFHKSRWVGHPEFGYEIPYYSPDIDHMVRRAGGYPDPAGINLFYYPEVRRIWPTCVLNPPLPPSDPRQTVLAAR